MTKKQKPPDAAASNVLSAKIHSLSPTDLDALERLIDILEMTPASLIATIRTNQALDYFAYRCWQLFDSLRKQLRPRA